MEYQSTRNCNIKASSTKAVLDGIAPDGGLYVQKLDQLSFDWRSLIGKTTLEMSSAILHALLPDFHNMEEIVRKSYQNKFETEDLTPVVSVGNRYVLELFRGPTSAFKDVALSVLPQLITNAQREEHSEKEVVILTATSGDTGKAALEGFHDVDGTKIIVFYPDGGVSKVQKAQMVTQVGKNVCVCAVKGNFDDAQTGVKNIFAACEDKDLGNVALSSANSINIGRLVPQIVYYFKAYSDLCQSGRINAGDAVHFVVPTGNFGDILAGYFAKKLGLPVGKLVCASNANDVLTEFLSTGVYDKRRPFYKTTSPSMDILVSSNLERLLYLLSGDDQYVKGLMKQLNENGFYKVSDQMLNALQQEFSCGCANDEAAKAVIGKVWKEHHYLCDPHTAVAWAVSEQFMKQSEDDTAPVVVLSTASPYKFPGAVLDAIGEGISDDEFAQMTQLQSVTGIPIPNGLASLRSREVLHTDCIEKDDMLSYVLKKISIKEWR